MRSTDLRVPVMNYSLANQRAHGCSSSDRDTAVGAELSSHAVGLAGGELGHAAASSVVRQRSELAGVRRMDVLVVSVVHVVVDGVNARARAGVATGGAAVRGLRLSGGIRNAVTATAAATLEGVVETDPVTGFMSQSLIKKDHQYP